MSIALQIALFLASIAIVALVGCIVPIAFQVGRSLNHLALTTGRLEASAQALLQDSRELVRNISELSERTNRYMEEVGKVVRIVELWTERADVFVRQVGSLIDPPLLTLACNWKVLGVGAAAFMRTLLHPNQQQQSKSRHNPEREEQDHV